MLNELITSSSTGNYLVKDHNEYGDLIGTRFIQSNILTSINVHIPKKWEPNPARSICHRNCYKDLKQAIADDPIRDILCAGIDAMSFNLGCKANAYISCMVFCL